MAVYKMTPTKGNLIKAKSSLDFAKKGYDLLDRKRTVLIREMMSLVNKASKLQANIEKEFETAYLSLQEASITIGSDRLDNLSHAIEKEKDFDIIFKSVMGIETPVIKYEDISTTAEYSFFDTNPSFDKAVIELNNIRKLIYELAEIENSVYNLAIEIKKTQKRANALDKIQIPKYKQAIKTTEDVLAEKEREEFFRLKKVKKKKEEIG
ncbi:MAG: V-type ATP synthase subunit D [Tissierellia bacterium]|nr:V-type ATP synthase subunit D [Tissierellia bacterium]